MIKFHFNRLNAKRIAIAIAFYLGLHVQLFGQTPLNPPVTITGGIPGSILLEIKAQNGGPGILVRGTPALHAFGLGASAIYAQSNDDHGISVYSYWRQNDASSLYAFRPVDSGYAIHAQADSINNTAAKLQSKEGYALKTIGKIQLSGQNASAGKVLTAIDANGNANWQYPQLFAKTGFEVVSDSNSNIRVPAKNAQTPLVLVLPNLSFNDNSSYNLNSGFFEVSIDGVYHFDVEVEWGSTQKPQTFGQTGVQSSSLSGKTYLIIMINGAPSRYDVQPSFSNTNYSQNISVNLELDAGDKVSCSVGNGTTSVRYIHHAFFSGFKVY
jgi:hypothetical protein